MKPIITLVLIANGLPAAETLNFRLDLGPEHGPYSGRAFVLLTKSASRGVPRGVNWFRPEPAFAMPVSAWKTGSPITIDGKALAYPTKLMDLPAGTYYAQAVLDRDLGGISPFQSPGNLYSKAKKLEHDPAKPQTLNLTLDQVVDEVEFSESDTLKCVKLKSQSLSDFHKRPITLRAGVVLPPSYGKEKDRTYPIVYEIPGFGGDHHTAGVANLIGAGKLAPGVEAIWVTLDPNCRRGHHVFTDSANNGPYGTALVREFIPHLEKQFRANGRRLVTGHSSGGWASLWLQVKFPETFAGCWSTSPDPVDFRDFQRVNLYERGANLFFDGKRLRELSRSDRGTPLTFRSFSAMEDLTGHGGQLASFEAVFSPRGKDGEPLKLWDRTTGAIDPAVAEAWKAYDIRRLLDEEWKTLEPKLKGKIHVWCGEEDTFLLDGPTRLLQTAMKERDAVVEMMPNKTHNLMDLRLQKRMKEEMTTALK